MVRSIPLAREKEKIPKAHLGSFFFICFCVLLFLMFRRRHNHEERVPPPPPPPPQVLTRPTVALMQYGQQSVPPGELSNSHVYQAPLARYPGNDHPNSTGWHLPPPPYRSNSVRDYPPHHIISQLPFIIFDRSRQASHKNQP